MALFTTSVRAFSNIRGVTFTPTGATPPDALKAVLAWIEDSEAAIARGETLTNLAAATIVLTGKQPFIVYRFTAVTVDYAAGTYAVTFDESAPNNESLS